MSKCSSRDLLVEAAKKLFSLKGYSLVTTREIAEEAGVNLGSIQYYFGSKESLFIESLRDIFSSCKEDFIEDLKGNYDSLSKEEALVILCRIMYFLANEDREENQINGFNMVKREVLNNDLENANFRVNLVRIMSNEFFSSFDELISGLISKVMPKATSGEKMSISWMIYSSCNTFSLNKFFYKEIRGEDPTVEPKFSEIKKNIAKIVLKGMGIKDRLIQKTLKESDKYM